MNYHEYPCDARISLSSLHDGVRRTPPDFAGSRAHCSEGGGDVRLPGVLVRSVRCHTVRRRTPSVHGLWRTVPRRNLDPYVRVARRIGGAS